MMKLAHMSDLHVLDLSGIPARRFLNKRVTGMANLLGARRDAHSTDILETAVQDAQQHADHVAITGDFTNLALESEFDLARQLVEPLGGRQDVSVIPGNHDVYTGGSKRSRRFEQYFGDFMWKPGEEQTYPWCKRVGEINLVGLMSAHPVPPLFAYGWIEDDQLERLGELADGYDFVHRFTVAMIHHNLHPRSRRKNWMHGLRNRDEVLDICESLGVDLLLHGHTHKANRFRHGRMEVIGSGSTTWASTDPAHTGRYNLYHIDDDGLVDVEVRVYSHADEEFRAR